MDAWVGVVGGDDVAGGDDLFGGEIDDEVAAGVGGRPVVELELLAFEGEGFFGLGDDLRRLVIGGRRSLASGGECGLLLLLVVLVRDDFYAGGEGGEAVDVVAVAVGEDDGGDGFRSDLRDVVEQLLAACLGGLGVDDDDAVGADDDGAVAAAALDPVDVGLELMGDEWVRRAAAARWIRRRIIRARSRRVGFSRFRCGSCATPVVAAQSRHSHDSETCARVVRVAGFRANTACG